MERYILRDDLGAESEPFEAASEEEAVRLAREDMRATYRPAADGSRRTAHVEEMLVRLTPDGEEDVGRVHAAVHPSEPAGCREHVWAADTAIGRELQAEVVGGFAWGSGGGVQVAELCLRCGVVVTRDTGCRCEAGGGVPHECRWIERRAAELWEAAVRLGLVDELPDPGHLLTRVPRARWEVIGR